MCLTGTLAKCGFFKKIYVRALNIYTVTEAEIPIKTTVIKKTKNDWKKN